MNESAMYALAGIISVYINVCVYIVFAECKLFSTHFSLSLLAAKHLMLVIFSRMSQKHLHLCTFFPATSRPAPLRASCKLALSHFIDITAKRHERNAFLILLYVHGQEIILIIAQQYIIYCCMLDKSARCDVAEM